MLVAFFFSNLSFKDFQRVYVLSQEEIVNGTTTINHLSPQTVLVSLQVADTHKLNSHNINNKGNPVKHCLMLLKQFT